jgi:hypothetical protein
MRDKKALRDAMAYMDWIGGNAAWLTQAIATQYSAAKADEFAKLEFKARATREEIRKMFIEDSLP